MFSWGLPIIKRREKNMFEMIRDFVGLRSDDDLQPVAANNQANDKPFTEEEAVERYRYVITGACNDDMCQLENHNNISEESWRKLKLQVRYLQREIENHVPNDRANAVRTARAVTGRTYNLVPQDFNQPGGWTIDFGVVGASSLYGGFDPQAYIERPDVDSVIYVADRNELISLLNVGQWDHPENAIFVSLEEAKIYFVVGDNLFDYYVNGYRLEGNGNSIFVSRDFSEEALRVWAEAAESNAAYVERRR
jgi:hypothetical protein